MKNRKSVFCAVAVLPALAVCAGCYTSHKIESTHEIKPIHITLDVNVKIDRALDDFFGDIDKKAVAPAQVPAAPELKATPQPAQKVDDPIPGEAAPAVKVPPQAPDEKTETPSN